MYPIYSLKQDTTFSFSRLVVRIPDFSRKHLDSKWFFIYSVQVTYTVNIPRETSYLIIVGDNNMWEENRCQVMSPHEILYPLDSKIIYGINPNYPPPQMYNGQLFDT